MTSGTRLPGGSALRVGIDAVVHALLFVVLVVIIGAVAGVARGETVVMIHNMLFLLGIVLLGIGTLLFSFSSPVAASNKNKSRIHRRGKRKRLESLDSDDDSKVSPTTSEGILPFHKSIWSIPPLRWMEPPKTSSRVHPSEKIMLAGVLSLGFWVLVSVAQIA